MRVAVCLFLIMSLCAVAEAKGPGQGQGKKPAKKPVAAKPAPAKPTPPPAPAATASEPAPAPPPPLVPSAASPGNTVKVTEGGKKVKEYDFSAMGIQGKVLTPQLLYLLGRIKVELEKVALEKRSFVPELIRSVDEGGL